MFASRFFRPLALRFTLALLLACLGCSAASQPTPAAPRAIAFIDAAVQDPHTLLAALPADMETILLRADEDGLRQIAAHLATRQNIPAVHVFSHGAPGKLQLGDRWLDQAALATHTTELATIRRALAPEAYLHLYGYNVASTPNFAQQGSF
jgi:hypothetical protein